MCLGFLEGFVSRGLCALSLRVEKEPQGGKEAAKQLLFSGGARGCPLHPSREGWSGGGRGGGKGDVAGTGLSAGSRDRVIRSRFAPRSAPRPLRGPARILHPLLCWICCSPRGRCPSPAAKRLSPCSQPGCTQVGTGAREEEEERQGLGQWFALQEALKAQTRSPAGCSSPPWSQTHHRGRGEWEPPPAMTGGSVSGRECPGQQQQTTTTTTTPCGNSTWR